MSQRPDPIEEYLSGLAQQERGEGDPIEQYLSRTQRADPSRPVGGAGDTGTVFDVMSNPVEYLQRLFKNVEESPATQFVSDAGELGRMLTSPEGARKVWQASRGDPEALADIARFAPAAAGLAEGAVARPVEGILGFPGALLGTEDLPTDKAADWINRTMLGARNSSEEAALRAGATEEQIANAYNLGNFVGFFAPIAGSLKIASGLLRTGQSLGQVMTSGAYTTDFVAGLVFGGLMQPGDAKERLGEAAWESAAFGVMRTAMMLGTSVRALRHGTARRRDLTGRLNRILDDMENGRSIDYATPEEIGGILEIMQNENFIVHSVGAQELLMRREYDAALVKAITETQGTKGAAGVLRDAGMDWQDVVARVDKLKNFFPDRKFDIIKRVKGTREVVEGGMPSVPEGHVRIYRGTSHRATGDDWFTTDRSIAQMHADDANGKLFYLDMPQDEAARAGLGSMGGGDLKPSLEWARSAKPVTEGTTSTVDEVTYDIFFGIKGLNNKQKAQLKNPKNVEGKFDGQVLHYGDQEVVYRGKASREGWYKVEMPDGRVTEIKAANTSELPFIREDMSEMETSGLYQSFKEWYQEHQQKLINERGALTEVDLVNAVRSGRVTLDPDARRAFESTALVYPEELGLVGDDLVQQISYVTGDGSAAASIERNTRRGHPSKFNMEGTEQLEGQWRLTHYNTVDGKPVDSGGHWSFNTLEEAMEAAEELGMQMEDVVRKFPSAEKHARLVSESGTEYARLLDPPETMTFERIFDKWARENGIDPGAADYLSAQTYFAHRMRREIWDNMPEADRKIFDNILKEHMDLTSDQAFSIQQLAAIKGWHAHQLEDGSVLLRQIDSGLNMRFGGERRAREALSKIVNVSRDLDPLVRTGGMGIVDWSQGLPKSSQISFDEVIVRPEKLDKIHRQWYRNNRDALISIEQQTGIPVWSKGFEPIQKGYTRMMSDLDPYAQAIQSAWRGIKPQRKHAVAEFWVSAEQRQLTLNKAVREMQELGFSKDEINALRRSRAIFDDLFAQSGIDRSRYIEFYYTRVKPYAEAHNHVDIHKIFGRGELRPAELNFWAEFTRTGDLAVMEMDPEYVMHKYARTLFFNNHVKEHWDELARFTGTSTSPPLKFKDLPQDAVEQMRKEGRIAPGTTEDTPVMPAVIREMLAEYLVAVRGQTSQASRMTRGFAKRLFKTLNIDADERVIEEMVNSWISLQYGAAMGIRPMAVARNMTQTMFLLYPRLGSRFMGRGLDMSMTREGAEEAYRVGAIPVKEAGIPSGDLVLQHIMQRAPRAMEGGGLFSMGLAKGMRGSMHALNVGRDLSQKSLIWYSSSDQASRAWSYWAQKLHTDDWLKRYEAGKISWEKFEHEGLGFFPAPLKKEFLETYNRVGREEALQHAGRWASDETNFIYGMGAQPAWLQTIPGRLAGMFGTWPMWAIEGYTRPLRHADWGQRAKFYARTAAFTGAIANMGIQMGVNVWSWLAPLSTMGWAGGPAVEHAINFKEFLDAPMDQKGRAFGRMARDMTSLVVPGQIAFHDAMRASELASHNPELGLLSLLMGRPYDTEHIGLEYLYNPDRAGSEPLISPETNASLNGEYEVPAWVKTIDFGGSE